ncbi:hypothetical protein [Risungbinella massiliensis]|uniref:hypothetical protein n=1 Tax=Risungbinella massiliensis TaxID=1329796 RepID=UPI0005CC3F8E|nr:hypothetical protein [Risungbinella massiliensis]
MAKLQDTAEIIINVPIDQLFLYFYGPLDKMKISSPTKLLSNDPISITDKIVGSIYRRTFDLKIVSSSFLKRESAPVDEYVHKEFDFTILDFLETPDQKKIVESYTMEKIANIKTEYLLKKVDEQTTSLQYTYSYSFISWLNRLMFRFSKFDPNVFIQDMKYRIEADFFN